MRDDPSQDIRRGASEAPPRRPDDSASASKQTQQPAEAPKKPEGTPKKPSQTEETPPKSTKTPQETDAAGDRRGESAERLEAIPEDAAASAAPPRMPPQPPVKPVATLTLTMQEAEGKLDARAPPKTLEEIPRYLYSPSSKSYKMTCLIIFENVKDIDTLATEAEVTRKTASTIWNTVRRIAAPILRPHRRPAAAAAIAAAEAEADADAKAEAEADAKANRNDLTNAHRPRAAASAPASAPASASETSAAAAPPPAASKIMMHPYELPDGRIMYFPTKLSDIKDHEEGTIGVNNLLIRADYLGSLELEDDSVLDSDRF